VATQADWFIAARVRRLLVVLAEVPDSPPGVERQACLEHLRNVVSGPRLELPQQLEVLREVGLLSVETDRLRRSAEGQRVASMNAANARRQLASIIIQSGLLHDQVRRLIEASTLRPDGSAFARVGQLRRVAPQLMGLLASWQDVVGPVMVDIPASIFTTIDTPWSLIPLPRPDDGRRKAVGSRAEAYSFHYLRLSGASSPKLTWVALDDESLGYDIEDRTAGDLRRVEVKGSEQQKVRFFLSENEHRVAHADPETYAVHFWGDINLNRNPNVEFNVLRSRGFPVVFDNLADHLADGRLDATPTKFRVYPGAAFATAYPPVMA
jgi:hypothetical protein